ncbi:MAG: AmmeMemoRadiSam system protein B [Halothiobacillaceae bacterium]|nr:MAG: AmmeMemoRadiSam system protein B [Halothiobacillaceae bacterium]
MPHVRPAAVAGRFYPAQPSALLHQLDDFIAPARETSSWPKVLIAPHAGYIYSGPIAGQAYALLRAARGQISRVVLLGPAHFVRLRGLALPEAEAFATPLGTVPVDMDAVRAIADLPQVIRADAPHAPEHSLEVHLPFLQHMLDGFSVVPLVVGDATYEAVAEVIERLWGGPETLIVISTDLSHVLDYATARALDAQTAEAIEALQPEAIRYEQACGRTPLGGLLQLARQRGMRIERLDLRNSGDTAGPRDQVVGYGAWALYEESPA